ncbi:helix-turn-helix transcriptional regulator [Marinimicrobium sp. ARAG 43.8]|uniref:helix-turn-helix transcriptional regulator n=1 Tax=Marinimicrobium sp. ARAG 43.8 TaxID=3418719 RepID=UPI003CFA822B
MPKIRNAMTDEAIAKELGQRLAQVRINAELTQDELADAIGMDRGRISRLESSGSGKLSTVVAVLRQLDRLDLLEQWLPQGATLSPLKQLASEQKKPSKRKRVRKPKASTRSTDSLRPEDDLKW